jgi:hypothetical protein
MSDDLKSLVLPEEYRAERANLFPSPQSLAWFMRQHRVALIDAGALSTIAGKHRIHPARADAVVSEVGQQAARKAIA